MEIKPGLRRHEVQRMVLEFLKKGPKTSKYMAEKVGVSTAVILKALRGLRDEGMVECRRTRKGILWFLKTEKNLKEL